MNTEKTATAELKRKFNLYYADLKDEAKRNGYRVNKADEWERFVEAAKNEAGQ